MGEVPEDVGCVTTRNLDAADTFRIVPPTPPNDVAQAYDRWAASYDADKNATRDLDAIVVVCEAVTFQAIEPVLRETLREQVFGPPASEVPVFEGLLGADAVLIGAATAAASIGAGPASR